MTEHEAVAGAAVPAQDFLSNPSALVNALQMSLNEALGNLVQLVPNLIAAIVLIVVGWAVGSLISGIVKRILQFFKFEEFLKSHRVEDALGNVQISDVLVQLTKYYVILVFVQVAVALLALGPLTEFLTKVIDFAPKVIGALFVAVVAAMIGELVKEKVLEVHKKEAYMRLLGNGGKYIVVFMGLVVGLETLGFPTAILTNTFLTLVQALGFAFALAIGLAFGFGGQEAAKEWVGEWRSRLHV